VFVLWFLLIVLIALNNRAGESRSDDSKTGGD
jgi:hypothetical protein